MKRLRAALLLVVLSCATAFGADKPPVLRYLGEWSDGRGEVLVVTDKKLRTGAHVASYKEISRSADLRSFRLRVTSGGGLSGFGGNYFSVEVSREEMRMRSYRTLADLMSDQHVAAVVSWERDR